MSEVIVVEDVVTMDCRRVVHLMSNTPFPAPSPISKYEMGEGGKAEIVQEAGVWHLRAEWPFWGMLDVQAEGWPRPRRLLVCRLREGERVSEMIEAVAERWMQAMGWAPKFAWVRELPEKAEWGQDVFGCILLAAKWLPGQCVAVGGRR